MIWQAAEAGRLNAPGPGGAEPNPVGRPTPDFTPGAAPGARSLSGGADSIRQFAGIMDRQLASLTGVFGVRGLGLAAMPVLMGESLVDVYVWVPWLSGTMSRISRLLGAIALSIGAMNLAEPLAKGPIQSKWKWPLALAAASVLMAVGPALWSMKVLGAGLVLLGMNLLAYGLHKRLERMSGILPLALILGILNAALLGAGAYFRVQERRLEAQLRVAERGQDFTRSETDRAIHRGALYLLSLQRGDGSWGVAQDTTWDGVHYRVPITAISVDPLRRSRPEGASGVIVKGYHYVADHMLDDRLAVSADPNEPGGRNNHQPYALQ